MPSTISHDITAPNPVPSAPAFAPAAPLQPTLGISQAARAASTALREAGEGAAAAKVLAEMAVGEDERARVAREDDRHRERSRLQALGELAIEDTIGGPVVEPLRERVRRRIELAFEANGPAIDVLAEAHVVLTRWTEEERLRAEQDLTEASRAEELARLRAAIDERDEQLMGLQIDAAVTMRRAASEQRQQAWLLERERRAGLHAVRAVAAALLSDMQHRSTVASIALTIAKLGMPGSEVPTSALPDGPALTPAEQRLAAAVAGDLAAGRVENVVARARQLAAAGLPSPGPTPPAARQRPPPAG